MTDEMMHAQMAALYAQQRDSIKPVDHLESLLPPELCSSVRHYATARDFTTQQALFHIVSKFFGSCFKSQPSAILQPTPSTAK
jgi:hypothetical protein